MLLQEVAFVDGGPDSWSLEENPIMCVRINQTSRVGGDDVGEFGIFATFIGVIVSTYDFGVISSGVVVKFGKGIKFNVVIWFDDTDIFAAGFFQTTVHAVAVASILLFDDFDAGVRFLEILDDFG